MSEARIPKRVLLVEDDEGVMDTLQRIVGRLGSDVEAVKAVDAGEAIRILRTRDTSSRIDAMILDVMMPYGNAELELAGRSDPGMDDTGVHLLEKLRQEESETGVERLWVGVVTARIHHTVLQRIEDLIGDSGRLYPKPFPTLLLQHHLACALGIESKVPKALLPDD